VTQDHVQLYVLVLAVLSLVFCCSSFYKFLHAPSILSRIIDNQNDVGLVQTEKVSQECKTMVEASVVMSPYQGGTGVRVKVKLSLCPFLIEHHTMKAYWGS